MEIIKSIFQALSRNGLLEKWLHAQTQNSNEAFNQLKWESCYQKLYLLLKE